MALLLANDDAATDVTAHGDGSMNDWAGCANNIDAAATTTIKQAVCDNELIIFDLQRRTV